MPRLRWVALVAPLFAAALVMAAPTDLTPTDINGPKLSPRAEESGAYSVNDRTGTVGYTYKFTLPPARGVGAELSLVYSSAGAVRGSEVAQGWSVGPGSSITRDVSREQPAVPGQTAVEEYSARFAGAVVELVRAPGDVSTGGETFRARIDSQFVRFEKVGTTWVARTSDGTTYYFGETGAALPGDWRLSRVVDVWGNTAAYRYDAVTDSGQNVDLLLRFIDYSSNAAASLPAHAQVELQYGEPVVCNWPGQQGSPIPVGASLDYRTGSRRILGVRRLAHVITRALQSASIPKLRDVRHWDFAYDPNAERCDGTVSPRRLLISISETGYAPDGSTTVGPKVQFTYGAPVDLKEVVGSAHRVPLPPATDPAGHPVRAAVASDAGDGSQYSQLMDFNGDGLPDLVQTRGGPECQATWYENIGGSFDLLHPHTFDLPRADPRIPTSDQGFTACNLGGASFVLYNTSNHCDGWDCFVCDAASLEREAKLLQYRWEDLDGDGRPDLIATPQRGYSNLLIPGSAPLCIDPACATGGCNTPIACRDIATNVVRAGSGSGGSQPPIAEARITCGRPNPNNIGNTCAPDCATTPPPPPPPLECTNGFVWHIFTNNGQTLDGATLDRTQWKSVCAPASLLDLGVLQGINPAAQSAALIDVNGDRLLDLVSMTFAHTWGCTGPSCVQKDYCPTNPSTDPMVFNVFLGDGTGHFGPAQLWSAAPTPNYPFQCGDQRSSRNPLLDINGDGLVDWVRYYEPRVLNCQTHNDGTPMPPPSDCDFQPGDWFTEVVYGNGHAFVPGAQRLLSALPIRGGYQSVPTQCPLLGIRDAVFLNFLKDVDGDGLLDFACLHPQLCVSFLNNTWQVTQGVAFGSGQGLLAPSARVDSEDYALSGYPGGRTSQIYSHEPLVPGAASPDLQTCLLTIVKQDLVDLNGDGVNDVYRTEIDPTDSTRGNLVVSAWAQRAETAPALLDTIDNGVGGKVKFHYARTTDASVVQISVDSQRPAYATTWADWIQPSMPFHTWVVKQVDVSPDATTVNSTTYAYQDPVFAPDQISLDAGRHVRAGIGRRFRGFQAVTTTLPGSPAPHIFERYTYLNDPDGQLDYKAVSDGTTKLTVDQTVFAVESLFGASRFVHPQSSWHIECQASTDPSACDNQTPFRTTTTYSYVPLLPEGSTLVVGYAVGSTTEDTTNAAGALERQTWTERLVRDTGAAYFVVPKRHRVLAGAPGALVEVTREESFYDGQLSPDQFGAAFGSFKGALTKKRIWRRFDTTYTEPACVDEKRCVESGTWYDPQTGQPIKHVRPTVMQKWNGKADGAEPSVHVTYDHDSFALFPTIEINEAGHRIERSFYVGTGAKLEQRGSNWIGQVPERDVYTYDGLGRVLTHQASKDDPTAGYVLYTAERSTYSVFPGNWVQHARARDFGGANWILTYQQFDGLDRVVVDQTSLDGVSLPTSGGDTRQYTYDPRGNLASVTGPSPAADGATVTTQFAHDARDRVIQVTPPALSTPDGAIYTITYAPWQKTVRDADGDVTHQTFDGFGRLELVEEFDGTAVAQTHYQYDGAGRLIRVHDADGKDTALEHDGAGNRTAIERVATRPLGAGESARRWTYSYDADGGLVDKQDPDQRHTTFGYDPIGRVQLETVASPGSRLSVTDAVALGLGSVHYAYDQGTNAVGHLSQVTMYAGTAAQPYTTVSYGYDALGNTSAETWNLANPAVGRTFALARTFGPLGILSETYPHGKDATWSYDARGKLREAKAGSSTALQSLGLYDYGVAGMVKDRIASASAPVQRHDYTFDQRGRLVGDQLSLGGTSAVGRGYAYSPDGDVQKQLIVDGIGGQAFTAAIAFQYDGLHRMRYAGLSAGNLPYKAALEYSGAGNITKASVSGALELPSRDSAVYTYGDSVAADVQAVTALTQAGVPVAQFTYDRAGNLEERAVPGWNGLTTRYQYDNNDQVRKVTDATNTSEQYYYDHNRNRYLSVDTARGRWRFYLGGDFEVDHSPTTEETSVYVSGGGESIARLTDCSGACQSTTAAVTLLHHDRRGDLLAAYSLNAQLQAHFIYGAFGEVVFKYEYQQGDWRRRFNGKEEDDLSKLSYYGYRFYDPLTMRWTTADPLYRFAPDTSLGEPHRLNLYTFTSNNPFRYVDPDGRQSVAGSCANPSSGACQYSRAAEAYKRQNANTIEGKLDRAAEGFGDRLLDVLTGGRWTQSQVENKTIRDEKNNTMATPEYKGGAAGAEAVIPLLPGGRLGKLAQKLGEKAEAEGPSNPPTPRRPTTNQREGALERSQGPDGKERCTYCGAELDRRSGSPNSAEIDHRKAYSKGGKTVDENLDAACRTCNRSKGAKDLETEWVPPKNR